MRLEEKARINARSFRHRIRDRFHPFFDESHLMGLDPFETKLHNEELVEEDEEQSPFVAAMKK